MKRINDLIIVEVPKWSLCKISGTNHVCHKYRTADNHWQVAEKLPEGEYEIIGLASGISYEQTAQILRTIGAMMWAEDKATDVLHRILFRVHGISAPPSSDLLFIKTI